MNNQTNQRRPDYEGTPTHFYGTYPQALVYANTLAADIDKTQKGLTKITKVTRIEQNHYTITVDGWFDPPCV